jgi:dUTP pyrophosphatase
MIVKFKKLHENAVLPTYAKPGDAGLDLTAVSKQWSGIQFVYGTGIAVEIPEGYVGLIFPRSSVYKYELALSNSVGVVDSGYRGEIQFIFNPTTNNVIPKNYNVGDRIGQLVIIPYPTVIPEWSEELTETARGSGGFGSSGT